MRAGTRQVGPCSSYSPSFISNLNNVLKIVDAFNFKLTEILDYHTLGGVFKDCQALPFILYRTEQIFDLLVIDLEKVDSDV